MNPVLSARNLRKTYGNQVVVDGVNISLQKGECFGLLGPNGAGKTTTLRLMLGLVAPDAGELQLLGHAVPRHARGARVRVGVVPQIDNLDPDFTVAENLLVYGRYFGMSDAAIHARMPDLLEFANLSHKRDVKVPTLSGGMKRRLTLARALVNDPDVIFLDEPTTGLDPQARHLIWQRLRDLIAQNIEPQVVEVFGEPAAAWAREHAARHAQRFEVSGESVYCYVTDAQPLLRELQQHPELRYLHRPANLEDVFLKLTGREMRE